MASSYLPSRASPRPMLASARAPASVAAHRHATDASRIGTDFIESILESLFLTWYLDSHGTNSDLKRRNLFRMGNSQRRPMSVRSGVSILALLLLAFMFLLAGGAALRESVTIDEVAHIGAGLSYLQKLDLRYNEEHPPLAKVLAALPLAVRGTHADYSGA